MNWSQVFQMIIIDGLLKCVAKLFVLKLTNYMWYTQFVIHFFTWEFKRLLLISWKVISCIPFLKTHLSVVLSCYSLLLDCYWMLIKLTSPRECDYQINKLVKQVFSNVFDSLFDFHLFSISSFLAETGS